MEFKPGVPTIGIHPENQRLCGLWGFCRDDSLWFSEISQQLGDTSIGVICLTQENKERPWILFEAGALAKGLNSTRVCTFLIDLQPKDVTDPLGQFNHTLPTKENLLALVQTINMAMDDKALDGQVLSRVFDTYWPQFEIDFKSILESTTASPHQPRKQGDILEEILESTRSLNNRLRVLEQREANKQSEIENSIRMHEEHDMFRRRLRREAEIARAQGVQGAVSSRATRYGVGENQIISPRKGLKPGDTD